MAKARAKSAVVGSKGRERASLERAIQPMPSDVRRTLTQRGLMAAYRARPAYQQNDYLGWMARAKLAVTREKRFAQMLDELERGGVYMNMKWAPQSAVTKRPLTGPRSAAAARKAAGGRG